MKKKLLPVLLLLCLWANNPLFAQTDIPKSPHPVDFISYFDLGIGNAGGELGLSARVRDRLATGLFFKAFWYDSDAMQNLDSWYMAGIKVKLYKNKSDNSLYVGPLVALHGFQTGIRPLMGLNAGYDHYTRAVIFWEDMSLRLGVGLEGGFDTKGNGYVEVGFNVGFGYSNNGDIKRWD